jgi:response regulator NasT
MCMKIAVADDERDTCEYLEEILTVMGHQVVAACSDGEALVEACEQHAPQLVITDIKMPRQTGVEAAKEIYRKHRIPVILVSAYHEPALVAEVSNLQVPAYLVKPIRQSDLETVIPIAVRRFEQYEALKSLVHGVLDARRTERVCS